LAVSIGANFSARRIAGHAPRNPALMVVRRQRAPKHRIVGHIQAIELEARRYAVQSAVEVVLVQHEPIEAAKVANYM